MVWNGPLVILGRPSQLCLLPVSQAPPVFSLQCAQNVPLPSQKQFSLQYGNACVQPHSEQIVFPLSYLGVRVPTQRMGRLCPTLTERADQC